MRNKIFYLVVFVMIATVSKAGSYQLKYRIECAKSNDQDLISIINKIPELRTFMLPSGSEIYFSGDYFFTYPEAKTRLDEVVSLGFKDAFIRVFKYQKMLTKPVGNRYITKVEALIERKAIEKKKAEELSFRAPVAVKNKVVRKTFTKKEIEERKKKRALAKKTAEEKLAVKTTKKLKKEAEDNTSKTEEKEEEVGFGIVDEAPIYKILLAKTKSSDETPDLVQLLTDEIVYSYKEGRTKYYAVGFYETSKHAERRKDSYKRYATQQPEIIGLYKGKIISLKLAKELHKEFKRNSTKL